MTNIIDFPELMKDLEAKNIEESKDIKTKSAEVINWLFTHLISNFPAFKHAWPTKVQYDEAKRLWLNAFFISKITRVEQIRYGLDRCVMMETPFVPSPGQFISWCKPNMRELGLPEYHEAFRVAVRMNQIHGDFIPEHLPTYIVIGHAINQIGASKFRIMSERDAFKTFEFFYNIAARQYVDGDIKDIPKTLPKTPAPHPIDRERADKARKMAMVSMRAKLQ